MSPEHLRERVHRTLTTVMDPELPAVSVWDLGLVREVELLPDRVRVWITPSFSGCPAQEVIASEIKNALTHRLELDSSQVEVATRLAPAWTTAWITPEGLAALAREGIAPPQPHPTGPVPVQITARPQEHLPASGAPGHCPRCGGEELSELSRFAGSGCRALWRCRSCHEPFEYFKRH